MTAFTLEVAGRNIKPHRFEGLVSGQRSESLCWALALVHPNDAEVGRWFPQPDCEPRITASPGTRPTSSDLVARVTVAPEELAHLPLQRRIAILTCGFEVGSLVLGECFGEVNGNFDGSGLSLSTGGSLRNGRLGALLAKMESADPAAFRAILGDQYETLRHVLASDQEAQVAWADSISTGRSKMEVQAPWPKIRNMLTRCAEGSLGSGPNFDQRA